jgi:sec-independent protein translocase protein TatB
MFDITSSKLLLLAIVALLVIGPKEFPALLRTIGKYVGIIRGHAKEFRAQFDEMARESELAKMKEDMEKIAKETEASIASTSQSVEQSLEEAKQSVESTLGPDPLATPDPFAPNPADHDANGLPLAPATPALADASAASPNGAAPPPGAEPSPEPQPEPETLPAADTPAAEPGRTAAAPAPAHAPERTGA